MPRAALRGDAFTWHHITRPSAADFTYIAEHFPLDEVDVATLKAGVDLPRMHDRTDWHLLAFHIPQLATAKNDLLKTSLYVLLNKHTVLTITDHETRLNALFDRVKKQGKHGKLSHGNTLEVVSWLMNEVFDGLDAVIDMIYERIGKLEKRMHRMNSEHVTRELAMLRRDVLALDLMVEPAQTVIEQAIHTRQPYRGEAAHNRLVNLYDRLHGMHVVLRHYIELIEGIFQVHETTLSHRTNQTVQLLTAISVVLMPATLVTSYYGMNIAGLPWVHDIRIVSAVVLLAMLLFLLFVLRIYRK